MANIQFPEIDQFIAEVEKSLSVRSFLKITFAGHVGDETDLKKIHARPVVIKREEKITFTYQYKTRDIVKNYSHTEAVQKIAEFIKYFKTSTLFTTDFDLHFEQRANETNIKKTKSTNVSSQSAGHDRQKGRYIDAGQKYLQDLQITDKDGQVYKNAQDKFRQINRYVELLDPLLKKLPKNKKIKVGDMGSGKGYLTFALYDYMKQNLALDTEITGVENRPDMVDLCNKIALSAGFADLGFVRSSISDYESANLDVLIALHACDTATDEAIFKGIKAKAEIIVVAPCCHKQVRQEMEKSDANNDVKFLTKHGILLERQAEMITDALRAELLQYAGYTTKVFEFISAEHTAKNVMITAVKNSNYGHKNNEILKSIGEIRKNFGIQNQKLCQLLDI